MTLAEFEPTIPVFKRAKTFHALDRAATVAGLSTNYTALCPKVTTFHNHRCENLKSYIA
jgi:hypothetical protein